MGEVIRFGLKRPALAINPHQSGMAAGIDPHFGLKRPALAINPHQSGMAAGIDPHISGEARCMQCKHEWVAVAPVGTDWLTCPLCTSGKGFFVWPCSLPVGAQVWTCDCGSQLFKLSREGWVCPQCGVYCSFPRPGE